MELEDAFLSMLKESIDDLRSGKLTKSKFIGKYMETINKIDRTNAFRYKRPQVIGEGSEVNNNWLDYMMGLSGEEFEHFKNALTTN